MSPPGPMWLPAVSSPGDPFLPAGTGRASHFVSPKPSDRPLCGLSNAIARKGRAAGGLADAQPIRREDAAAFTCDRGSKRRRGPGAQRRSAGHVEGHAQIGHYAPHWDVAKRGCHRRTAAFRSNPTSSAFRPRPGQRGRFTDGVGRVEAEQLPPASRAVGREQTPADVIPPANWASRPARISGSIRLRLRAWTATSTFSGPYTIPCASNMPARRAVLPADLRPALRCPSRHLPD